MYSTSQFVKFSQHVHKIRSMSYYNVAESETTILHGELARAHEISRTVQKRLTELRMKGSDCKQDLHFMRSSTCLYSACRCSKVIYFTFQTDYEMQIISLLTCTLLYSVTCQREYYKDYLQKNWIR